MAVTSQSPRNALGICERRALVRAPVTPPIYVSLDNMNGGLVFNISEAGLALTAALDLADDDLLTLRIYLPDSKGWVEASGKIAWRGESEKEGGIRFVTLAEEARQRIREWLVAENLQVEAPREREFVPTAEQYPPNDTTALAPVFLSSLPVDSDIAEEEHPQALASANDVSLLIEQPAGIVAQPRKEEILGEPPPVEAEDLQELAERRGHERCAIDTISYVRLGRENGGTLLNISEGGFAVKAATPVCDADVATIRIQFTEAWDCLDVSGKIAWSNESEKKAGIQFVGLAREARAKITKWLSQDEATGEFQEQDTENLEDKAAVASPLAVRGIRGERLAATAGSSPKESAKEEESKPKSRQAIFELSLGTGTARMWHLVAAIVLAEITALAIVWVLAPYGFRQALIGFIARNGAVASEPALQKTSPPKNQTTDAPAVPAENARPQVGKVEAMPANDLAVQPPPPQGSLAPVAPQLPSVEQVAKTPALERTTQVAESASPMSKSATLPNTSVFTMPHPIVEHSRSQAEENPPAQLMSNTAGSPAGSLTAGSSTAGLPVASEKEVPAPPLEPPVAPAAPVWSVTVTADPYPSIKISRKKMSARKSSAEGNLQIGKIISRVDPAYPEDAKRQGVQGTVNLHVVTGRDGAVQKVEPINGSPLLTKAAISAIREWRYAKTLLDGQPVETEQDVVVNFRKVTPPSAQK
jgi:TonB family protein